MRRVLLTVLLGACYVPPPPVLPGDITIELTSPKAGDEMLASEHATIAVTGRVTSTNPNYDVLDLYVNGIPLAYDKDGNFTTELAPEVGINHVKVEAGDGIHPLVGQELDVLWAHDYAPAIEGTTGFDVASALDLRLGQRFFDARLFGTTLDLTTDPVVAHDLSSALELILWHVDLASLLPGGLHLGSGSSHIDVSIPAAEPAQILVDAKIINSPKAIDLTMDLNGVFLEMDGTFQFGNRTLLIDGGISADMHATARVTLAIANDGTVDVGVANVTAVVGPLVPAFTGPNGDELDAFITIGNNDFRTLIEGLIRQQLIPTFTDRVPPLLETLLGATDKLLDNVSFTLDTGLGGAPITLMMDGKIGSLEVLAGPPVGSAPGHVTVHQDVAIRTTGVPIHSDSRGAPRFETDEALPSVNTAAVHLNMKQQFLGSLLHALWNAGLLEGTAKFGGISAGVSAKLAPVVRPVPPSSSCTIDGARCDVLLQLGQVEIQLVDFEQSFGVSATAGARVVVNNNTISLKIQMTPELRVWETSTEHGILTPIAIRDLIANVVWPELFGTIGDNLSITLPIPDLADLGLDQLAPGLANAKLDLTMRQRPAVTPAYLGLGADLELSTPPPQ
jgi:hypothetical protein